MKFCAPLLLLLALASSATSQVKHPGVVLFDQGKDLEAVRILGAAVKDKTEKRNPELWNYLGLAQIRTNDAKGAQRSFQQAVKLGPTSAAYRANLAFAYLINGERNRAASEAGKAIALDAKSTMGYNVRGFSRLYKGDLAGAERDAVKIIGLDPQFVDGYKLKVDVLLQRISKKSSDGDEIQIDLPLFRDAIQTLETGIAKTTEPVANAILVETRDDLKLYLDHFSKLKTTVPAERVDVPGVVNFKLITKPHPSYTNEARAAGTQGKIRVVTILGADGRSRRPIVIRGLGNGLDENALAAARQIIFEPKTVNGKPVSVVIHLEYGFNIY
jgi:TonB family protein